MDGYGPSTQGDGYAGAYDELYAPRLDTDGAVALLAELAGGGPVLELGVGTGRLALPLAARGLEVTGIDASEAMVERLRARPGGDRVPVVVGDLTTADYPGPVALVVAAANLVCNLTTAEAQAACFRRSAAALAPHGCLVVEAFVPDDSTDAAAGVEARRVEADRVLLAVWDTDPRSNRAWGHNVALTGAGVELHPWSIRWVTPDALDAMAAAAGLVLEARWADWRRSPFGIDSPSHVSVYRPER